MRSVVRVAAYAPQGSASQCRVGAADEDEFTLGATALERALGDRSLPTEPFEIHLLGEFSPVADWGYAALLGTRLRVFHHPSTAEELTRTLRSLESEEGGPAIILVAELPERAEGERKVAPSRLGAGATAYLLNPSNRPQSFPLGRPGTNDSGLALAYQRLSATLERPFSQAFVGDWDVSPSAGRPVDVARLRAAADRPTNVVSEGAYVPRPRYLEDLPSRWRFVAEECDSCHEVTFPARGACRRCRRRDTLTRAPLPRDGGLVVALTTIGQGGQPTEFDAQVEASGPYPVALVELVGGTRVTLQVTDCRPGELSVGDRVDTVLRRLYPMEGEWRYGRKAVPSLP